VRFSSGGKNEPQFYDGTIIAVQQNIIGTISIRIMYDDGDEGTATYPDDDVELLAWAEVDALWCQSTKTLPSSGFYGVAANRGDWSASVRYAGKSHSLGTFCTKEEAAVAHDAATRQHADEIRNAAYNHESAVTGEAAAAAAAAQWDTNTRARSGFYGVSTGISYSDRWKATLFYSGKKYHVGTYRTKEEAAAAYDAAARKYAPKTRSAYNFESAEAGIAGAKIAVAKWEERNQRKRRQRTVGEVDEFRILADAVRMVGGKGSMAEISSGPAIDSDDGESVAKKQRRGGCSQVAGSRTGNCLGAQQRQIRRRPCGKSGFFGVSLSDGKWKCYFRYAGERKHIGVFRTKEEAAVAYDNAARQHAGETGNVRYNFESVEKGIKAAAAAAVVAWEQMHPSPLPKPKRKPRSGFYGVTASGCEWNAAITLDTGKIRHLKFRTKEEAAAAYDTAVRQQHGDGGGSDLLFNFESVEAAAAAAAAAVAIWEDDVKSKFGFYGVERTKRNGGIGSNGVWKATIFYADKKHYLGVFRTKEEAAVAYNNAARQHAGEIGNVRYNFESVEKGKAAAAAAVKWEKTAKQAQHTTQRKSKTKSVT
jgi:hypothetical protein